MTNLFTPAQARVPIGTVVINGRQIEVAINIEWARFFESLTSATNTLTGQAGRNGVDGPAVALLSSGDGGDGVEFIPGPQGLQGPRGEMGPAIFMLQDNETNDIFWPIKA